MRAFIKGVLVLALLFPLSAPLVARAEVSSEACDLALGPADLPADFQLAPPPDASLGAASDPAICDRVFQALPPGPGGVTQVRSLIVVGASDRQAADDFAQYRSLLLRSGWLEGPAQLVGDETRLFSGSDPAAGIYTYQQLIRRGNVVALTEATGSSQGATPEYVADLARVVDGRIMQDLRSLANPLSRNSVWPAVVAPRLVADARLASPPAAGQNLQLGGFSGLAAVNRTGTKFVAVTDRGPSFEVDTGRSKVLIMPLPTYTPSIVTLERQDNQLRVVERIGLRLPDGYADPWTGTPFVTGLPNSAADPLAFDPTGQRRWGLDPYGLDPSGLVVDPRDSSFWLTEEYGPSILHVAADGTILLRLMPGGAAVDAPGQNVRDSLPAELAQRKADRGFEGIAISPDGARLFAIMQSPLASPDQASGEASRNVRLLTLDLTGAEPVVDGMYVYQTQPAHDAGTGNQDDLRVGDLAALSATKLVVGERDGGKGGGYKMLFRIDLAEATNILGQTDFGGRTLEQLDDAGLSALEIRPVLKEAIVNLADLGWRLADWRGLSLVDESTVAVINDNNFGFGGYSRAGVPQPSAEQTRLSIVHLPGSLRE